MDLKPVIGADVIQARVAGGMFFSAGEWRREGGSRRKKATLEFEGESKLSAGPNASRFNIEH